MSYFTHNFKTNKKGQIVLDGVLLMAIFFFLAFSLTIFDFSFHAKNLSRLASQMQTKSSHVWAALKFEEVEANVKVTPESSLQDSSLDESLAALHVALSESENQYPAQLSLKGLNVFDLKKTDPLVRSLILSFILRLKEDGFIKVHPKIAAKIESYVTASIQESYIAQSKKTNQATNTEILKKYSKFLEDLKTSSSNVPLEKEHKFISLNK